MGHITSYELVEKTTGNDVSNGFLNRFMIAFTKREKIVPFPERTPDDVIKGFAERVIDIVRFSHTAGRISLTSDAKVTWGEIYHDLTTWEGGRVITSLFARSEMYCLMLAMLFALMDKRKEIDTPDLAAAYAWLEYWKHTLIYVFDGERMKVEADHKADFAEEVYQAIASLNGGQGCTQTEIYNHFGRNKSSAELAAALEHLMTRTPPRASVQSIRPNPKAKRPTKIYTAT